MPDGHNVSSLAPSDRRLARRRLLPEVICFPSLLLVIALVGCVEAVRIDEAIFQHNLLGYDEHISDELVELTATLHRLHAEQTLLLKRNAALRRANALASPASFLEVLSDNNVRGSKDIEEQVMEPRGPGELRAAAKLALLSVRSDKMERRLSTLQDMTVPDAALSQSPRSSAAVLTETKRPAWREPDCRFFFEKLKKQLAMLRSVCPGAEPVKMGGGRARLDVSGRHVDVRNCESHLSAVEEVMLEMERRCPEAQEAFLLASEGVAGSADFQDRAKPSSKRKGSFTRSFRRAKLGKSEPTPSREKVISSIDQHHHMGPSGSITCDKRVEEIGLQMNMMLSACPGIAEGIYKGCEYRMAEVHRQLNLLKQECPDMRAKRSITVEVGRPDVLDNATNSVHESTEPRHHTYQRQKKPIVVDHPKVDRLNDTKFVVMKKQEESMKIEKEPRGKDKMSETKKQVQQSSTPKQTIRVDVVNEVKRDMEQRTKTNVGKNEDTRNTSIKNSTILPQAKLRKYKAERTQKAYEGEPEGEGESDEEDDNEVEEDQEGNWEQAARARKETITPNTTKHVKHIHMRLVRSVTNASDTKEGQEDMEKIPSNHYRDTLKVYSDRKDEPVQPTSIKAFHKIEEQKQKESDKQKRTEKKKKKRKRKQKRTEKKKLNRKPKKREELFRAGQMCGQRMNKAWHVYQKLDEFCRSETVGPTPLQTPLPRLPPTVLPTPSPEDSATPPSPAPAVPQGKLPQSPSGRICGPQSAPSANDPPRPSPFSSPAVVVEGSPPQSQTSDQMLVAPSSTPQQPAVPSRVSPPAEPPFVQTSPPRLPPSQSVAPPAFAGTALHPLSSLTTTQPHLLREMGGGVSDSITTQKAVPTVPRTPPDGILSTAPPRLLPCPLNAASGVVAFEVSPPPRPSAPDAVDDMSRSRAPDIQESQEPLRASSPRAGTETPEMTSPPPLPQTPRAPNSLHRQPNMTKHATASQPDQWAKAFPACGGMAQSPIDIRLGVVSVMTGNPTTLSPYIHFSVASSPSMSMGFNAVRVAGDFGYLRMKGVKYKLLEILLRFPSEHSFEGKIADGELQLVHQGSNEGDAVIIAVLLTTGATRETFPFFNSLDVGLSSLFSPPKTVAIGPLDLKVFNEQLAGNFFHYRGSLTSPPCTEGAGWYVMQSKSQVHRDQIEKFRSVFREVPMTRSVQPLHGRLLVVDSLSTELDTSAKSFADVEAYQAYDYDDGVNRSQHQTGSKRAGS
eukprot:TRINITY_DN19282_c0_g1_i1.p1 TRINITY_DN19282_c0_g1~~TRINITY_DN19282_c0_g1_i1.p1  ORF type:complete len:1239 (-),score=144.44 TRINITY_DN19282_c0_g1_i1:27-3743(-)